MAPTLKSIPHFATEIINTSLFASETSFHCPRAPTTNVPIHFSSNKILTKTKQLTYGFADLLKATTA